MATFRASLIKSFVDSKYANTVDKATEEVDARALAVHLAGTPMCVCVYIYIYIYIYIYAYVYTYTYMYMVMCGEIHLAKCANTREKATVCVWCTCTLAVPLAGTSMCMYIYKHVYIHAYVCENKSTEWANTLWRKLLTW